MAVAAPEKRALGFIQSLPQTKGRWAGKPLTLMGWQQEALEKLYGTFNEDGTRQYRTTFWFVPRKNGKSTLAAANALYLLFADREPGAEVYGAAYDREQASIVFDQALAMLQGLPGNGEREGQNPMPWRSYAREKRIEVPQTNSKYEAIPAVAAGSHGYNAHGIIFDEFHTQKDRELWDVLTTSVGSREQPLTFVITTAGFDRESPCHDLYDYACKVRDGVIEDDSFLPVIYESEREDDWTDSETWERANPGLGTTVRRDYLERQAKRALEEPGYENTFRRLHLNQWTSSESKVIGSEVWDDCRAEFSEDELAGQPCYGGLDLASKRDVAALVWIFPEGETIRVLPRFFVPEENVDERTRKDGVPYRTWVDQGHLTDTPGNKIDYAWIEDRIRKDAETFDVRELGFDRWGANYLTERLTSDEVVDLVPVGMGYKSMSEPTRELLGMVPAGEIAHDGNPVLAWMADNLVVTEDPAGNKKPAKNKSREKIDGMVALIMALNRWLRHKDEDGPSSWEDPDKDLLLL